MNVAADVPKVAVLMPVFESGDFIGPVIDSILWQKGVSVRIFIFDDTETKETQTYISSLGYGEKIYFVDQSHVFNSSALSFFHLLRSFVGEVDNFDFISFADHDDIWLPYKLHNAISELDEKQFDIYSSSAFAAWIDNKKGILRGKPLNKNIQQQKEDFLLEGPGPGCTFVFRISFYIDFLLPVLISKSDLSKVVWHDWFIYYLARVNNVKWLISNRNDLIYLQTSRNVTGANIGLFAFIKRLKELRDGLYFEQAILIGSVLGYQSKNLDRMKRNAFLDRFLLLLNSKALRRNFFHGVFILMMNLTLCRKRK